MAATRAVAVGWPAALMVDCESTSESYVVRHISSKDFFERFWKIYRNKLQLDWLSATSRQKNNPQKIYKGYDKSETAVGKLLERRIKTFFDYFCVTHFNLFFTKKHSK